MLESVWLTALIVIVAGAGGPTGALYTPDVLMVPVLVEPPGVPFTAQETAVEVVPEIFALNCWVHPAGMEATEGVTVRAGRGPETGAVVAMPVIPHPEVTHRQAKAAAIKTYDGHRRLEGWFDFGIRTLSGGRLPVRLRHPTQFSQYD